jgi:hypothetical protein
VWLEGISIALNQCSPRGFEVKAEGVKHRASASRALRAQQSEEQVVGPNASVVECPCFGMGKWEDGFRRRRHPIEDRKLRSGTPPLVVGIAERPAQQKIGTPEEISRRAEPPMREAGERVQLKHATTAHPEHARYFHRVQVTVHLS